MVAAQGFLRCRALLYDRRPPRTVAVQASETGTRGAPECSGRNGHEGGSRNPPSLSSASEGGVGVSEPAFQGKEAARRPCGVHPAET